MDSIAKARRDLLFERVKMNGGLEGRLVESRNEISGKANESHRARDIGSTEPCGKLDKF